MSDLVTAVLAAYKVFKAIKTVAAVIQVAVAISSVARAVGAFGGSSKGGGRVTEQGQILGIKFDSSYPREVAVGTVGTGGSLAYATTSGTENRFLWRVIALSDGPIDSCLEVWANGEKLTFAGDFNAGLVGCSSHFKAKDGTTQRLFVRVYKGLDTQTVDPSLNAAAPAEWTSSCRGRSIAYAIVRMEYDTDAFQSEPQLFFVLKGSTQIYDPRTGLSGWSENAALLAAQALRGFTMNGVRVVGLGAAASDVPDAALSVAADACDDLVPLAAGGTERRYRAAAMLSGAEQARSLVSGFVEAMAGLHVDRGGEISFIPGVARTPVMHITDADLLSDDGISYADKRTGDELVNCIASKFVDPSQSWGEAALPPRRDAAAIALDGSRFETGGLYSCVTSRTQGQRLDQIKLLLARLQATAQFSLPAWGIELEPGDWITWQSARFTGVKTFRVLSSRLMFSSDPENPRARVRLSVEEIASTAYSWSTGDETNYVLGNATRPAAPTPWVDAAGRIIDWRGLPINASTGSAASRTVDYPLSSPVGSSIIVSAHTGNFVGQTVSFPSATITGLTQDTLYSIYYDLQGAAYEAQVANSATDQTRRAAPDRYVFIGTQQTRLTGGGFSALPPPPPGGGGGGAGGYVAFRSG